MCGSEPCRHEREFAGTQADTLTSFVKSNGEMVKAQAEVKALRATLAKVAALADEWAAMCGVNEWPDDLPTAVWADAGRAIRAALEPTQPKGTKP